MKIIRAILSLLLALHCGLLIATPWPDALEVNPDTSSGPFRCYKTLSGDYVSKNCTYTWSTGCGGTCTKYTIPVGVTCELCQPTYAPWKQCFYSTTPTATMISVQTASTCTGALWVCFCGTYTPAPPMAISCGVVVKTGVNKSDGC